MMLELKNIAMVLSGMSIQETGGGCARFMRLSDLSDLKAGRTPSMVRGDIPSVARALIIEEGDLLIGARGASTDVCFASPLVFGAFVSLDLYLVRPNRTIVNSQYLAAFLELATTQALLASGKQGTGLARLGKDALETMQIPLPAMRKQKLIAELRTALEGEAKILRKLADLSSIFGQEILMRAIEASGAQHNLIRSSQ